MKTLMIVIALFGTLLAQNVTITPEQERNWQLQVSMPELLKGQFLDDIVGTVEVPTRLLHTISIPFDVKILRLLANQYESLPQGAPLARVGGNAWLQMQQNLINLAIALHESRIEHDRKLLLCDEGIIAAKECIRSQASFESATAQFESARSMLLLFGVEPEVVDAIVAQKKIRSEFEVRAPVAGVLSQVGVQVGQSVDASQILFTVLEAGDLWLSANIAQSKAEQLHVAQEVVLEYRGMKLDSRIVSLAPLVDTTTQTVPVRFLLPKDAGLSVGLKASFRLSSLNPSVRIPKAWTVMIAREHVVFVKTEGGYSTQMLTVESEDAEAYYCTNLSLADQKLLSSGVAAIKGMMGGSDD